MHIVEAARRWKKIRRRAWKNDYIENTGDYWRYCIPKPDRPTEYVEIKFYDVILSSNDWEEYVEPGKLSAVEQIQAEAKYQQARETGDFFGTYVASENPNVVRFTATDLKIEKPESKQSAWKKFSEEKPMATKGLVFDLSTSILVRSYTGGGHRAEIATYFEGALTIGCHLLDQSQYEWAYIPE